MPSGNFGKSNIIERHFHCGVKAGADPSDCYPEISNVPASGRLWPVSDRRIRRSLTRLHLGLLGDLQCIVDLDSEIPNGAFEFGMAEEKLNGPEISCSPIDQRGFRPAK